MINKWFIVTIKGSVSSSVIFKQVPDYLDIIKHPMDFSTMRTKVDNNEYFSFESFEDDFYHVWHNATVYNQPETVYYKAGIRIRDAGTHNTVSVVLAS